MNGVIRYLARDALAESLKQAIAKNEPGMWVRAADFDERQFQGKQREVALQDRLTGCDEQLDAQRLRADTAEAGVQASVEVINSLHDQLAAAEQRIAEQASILEEMATEMTLAISDSQIRAAMTVIGRTRFLQILQAHNARIDAALNPNPNPNPEAESHAVDI